MRLSRRDFVPLLTIVAGGAIGASLSFSFLGRSPAVDVPAPPPVVAPSTLFRTFRLEMPPLRYEVPPLPLNSVEAIAAHLVREQRDIEAEMNRLAEARVGPGSEAGRPPIEAKEAMHDEIADLEREILRLSSEAQGEISELLDEAARTIEDDKLKERVRYSRGIIGFRDREYVREFEAETTRILEELQEELQGVSTASYRLFVSSLGEVQWIMREVR